MLNPLTLLTGTNKTAVYVLGGIVAAIILAAVVGWWAYGSGYDKAEALGAAKLATVEKQYADASTSAITYAYAKLERETKRANAVAGELISTRNRLDALKKQITGGMPYVVAHTEPCTFGAEFIGMYNDSHGLRSDAMPKDASAAGTTAQPGEARSAGGRILAGASVADLLAHGRDYGAYCQELEAQRDALKALLMGGE